MQRRQAAALTAGFLLVLDIFAITLSFIAIEGPGRAAMFLASFLVALILITFLQLMYVGIILAPEEVDVESGPGRGGVRR